MTKPEQFNSQESNENIEVDSIVYPLINEQLQRRYDRIAPLWNSEAYVNTRRDDLIPKLIAAADLRDGHRILEAMCGPALLSNKLKEAVPGIKMCGLDFSIGMLNQISEDMLKVQASVLGMPFEDETFDRILLRTAIYDLPRRMQRNALAEIARVMKKDGVFVLQTYIAGDDTKKTLNDIANMKDRLAGQYQDMGREPPRYFATNAEFLQWFEKVNLIYEIVDTFSSEIQLQKAGEMSESAKQQFTDFMSNLPVDVKKAIGLNMDSQGNCTYQLSGIIYRLRK